MDIGVSSFTYTWEVGVPGHPWTSPLGAAGLIARAAELGVPVVQLADNIPLQDSDTAGIDEIAAQARSLDVRIEVGTRGIGLHLQRYADIARQFGGSFVRVVVDTATDHRDPAQAIIGLAHYESYYRDRGLILAIENHDRFTTGELIRVVEELGDWTGICLDTVNSFAALEAPEQVIAALGPHAVNLHIKDFEVVRASHAMGFTIEGRPVGAGRLDVPKLIHSLEQHGRVTSGIIELWTPPQPTIDATIQMEQRWARQSIRYLQDLFAS